MLKILIFLIKTPILIIRMSINPWSAFKYLLILAFAFMSLPVLGCENCVTDTTTSSLSGFGPEALAIIATNNVQHFCDESVVEGVGEINFGLTSKDAHNTLQDERKGYLFVHGRDMNGLGPSPWSYSWLPNQSLRMATYQESLSHWMMKPEDAKVLLSQPAPGITQPESENIKSAIAANFSYDDNGSPSGPGAQVNGLDNPLARTVACGMITLTSSLACQRAIPRIKEIMNQHSGMTLPDTNSEVLTNSRYQEGLRLAALTLMEKADAKPKPSGDLFSDLKNSFVRSGINSNDAEDMTWNVIGVISTSGPNYGNYASSYGDGNSNRQTKVALSVIAAIIPLLNQRTKDADRLYSYPPQVETHCDNGKPYHFWMAAYLTRRLIKEGVTPTGAAAAVFTFEKAYQFASRSPGRNPEHAFTSQTFDGFNNIERMDLTYAAAGVSVGEQLSQNRSTHLNIDQGIQTIVKASKLMPTLNDGEAQDLMSNHILQGFKQWNDKLAPDSVYKFYNP